MQYQHPKIRSVGRRSCAYLIGYFFKNSKLDLNDEPLNMISTLIILLSDPDSSTVTVAGTSDKALLEGGSDVKGSTTEAHGCAIIEVLGREKRNEILAVLYMVRADVSLSVRQAALHLWKTIVPNTPKTLWEVMPVLMETLIASLASSSSERWQLTACSCTYIYASSDGRSLGELVRMLGERVHLLIIPILSKGLSEWQKTGCMCWSE